MVKATRGTLHSLSYARTTLTGSTRRSPHHLVSLSPFPPSPTPLTLVCSDPAVKQILLQLDESSPAHRFIIQDLDDTHLLVTADEKVVQGVKESLQVELERNNYVALET